MFFYCEPLFLTKGKKTEEGLAAGTWQHPQRQQRQACRSAPAGGGAPRASPQGVSWSVFTVTGTKKHTDLQRGQSPAPEQGSKPGPEPGGGGGGNNGLAVASLKSAWAAASATRGLWAYVVITPKGPTVHR